MTIKTKITLLGLLAVASLCYILGIRVLSEGREHKAKLQFLASLEVAERLSTLAHELQRERGITAGYLVVRSPANSDLLHAQYAATNKARAQLEPATASSLELLRKLAETRQMTTAGQIDGPDSFGFYTQAVVEILDRIDGLARDSDTTILTKDLSAYVHLLYAKEYLGQIRATINEALSRGIVDREHVATVVRLLNLHQFYGKIALRDASPPIRQTIEGVLTQPPVQKSFQVINSVVSGKGANVTADQWFITASYGIDQLFGAEQQAVGHLRQQAATIIAASERHLLMDAAVALAIALTLIFFAASAVLSLLRALNVLITNIEHTVATQDFANRIPPQDDDEMGVLSHNFNELMAIAEHLIKEKDYFASTDLLTGAYNRYRFGELFEIELQQVLRYGDKLALIMFDIDHFKQINDKFGHAAGDLVLKEIAHVVRETMRASDVLVRWGGEEFMILAPHTGEEAADFAEKLCQAVASHRFPHLPKITASFGVSAYVRGDSFETLFARTDEALYRAKNEGRNRVRSVLG